VYSIIIVERPAVHGEYQLTQGRNPFQGSNILSFNQSGTFGVSAYHSPGSMGAWSQPVELVILATLPYSLSGKKTDAQFVSTSEGGYAILLWCELNILNVTYRLQPYRNNSIQLLHHTPASPRYVHPIWSNLQRSALFRVITLLARLVGDLES
jgi:hypothetical protein